MRRVRRINVRFSRLTFVPSRSKTNTRFVNIFRKTHFSISTTTNPLRSYFHSFPTTVIRLRFFPQSSRIRNNRGTRIKNSKFLSKELENYLFCLAIRTIRNARFIDHEHDIFRYIYTTEQPKDVSYLGWSSLFVYSF